MATVNAAYFDSLTAQVNAINTCAALQALTNEVFADLQAQIDAIDAQITALLPFLSLTIPTDLPSVITWITNFVNAYINPQIAQYEQYVAQQIALLAAIVNLAAAIEAAAARLTSCTITVPTITP